MGSPISQMKRRAKLSKPNIPGPVAGPDQGANGPSQDQEIAAMQPEDKLESEKRATSSEVESESEDEMPPRNAARSAVNDLVNTYHLVLNCTGTRRDDG